MKMAEVSFGSIVEGFDGSILRPIVKYSDGVVVDFMAHHVMPNEVYLANIDFFKKLNWNQLDFASNGIFLPTTNYNPKDTRAAVALAIYDKLGLPAHNGYHAAYSAAVGDIVKSFRDAFDAGTFDGLSEAEWISRTQAKLNGLTGYLKGQLLDPNSPFKLHSGDISTPGTSADIWQRLRNNFNKSSLSFGDSILTDPSYRLSYMLDASAINATPGKSALFDFALIEGRSGLVARANQLREFSGGLVDQTAKVSGVSDLDAFFKNGNLLSGRTLNTTQVKELSKIFVGAGVVFGGAALSVIDAYSTAAHAGELYDSGRYVETTRTITNWSAGTVGGVILGGIGSLAGPGGTIVGGMVGTMIGEYLADLTVKAYAKEIGKALGEDVYSLIGEKLRFGAMQAHRIGNTVFIDPDWMVVSKQLDALGFDGRYANGEDLSDGGFMLIYDNDKPSTRYLVELDEHGVVQSLIAPDGPNKDSLVSYTRDADSNEIVVSRIDKTGTRVVKTGKLNADGVQEGAWEVDIEVGSGWETSVYVEHTLITGSQVGAIFGSNLGNIIAGRVSNNPFVQVAASSAFSTVLGNVGQVFDLYFANPAGGSGGFGKAVTEAFIDIDTDLVAGLKAAGISAVSSFLIAELAEGLGIGDDFGGQLFSVVGNSVLSAALTNISNFGAAGVFKNFDGLLFAGGQVGSLSVGISSFIGGYLAREIYAPHTVGGSIGGAIGGGVGSIIAASTFFTSSASVVLGSLVAGILLPGVGALVGTLLGSYIGDWLSGTWVGKTIESLWDDFWDYWDPPDVFYWENATTFDNSKDKIAAGTTVGHDQATHKKVATDLANGAVRAINQILDIAGGNVTSLAAPKFRFSGGGRSDTYKIQGWGGGKTFVRSQEDSIDPSHFTYVFEQTVLAALKTAVISEEANQEWQAYTIRALKESTATSVEKLGLQIAFAQVYGKIVDQVLDAVDATSAKVGTVNFASYVNFNNVGTLTNVNYDNLAEALALKNLKAATVVGDTYLVQALKKSDATTLTRLNIQLAVARGFQDFFDTQLLADGNANVDNFKDRLKDLGITGYKIGVPDFNTVAVVVPADPAALPANPTAAQKKARADALKANQELLQERLTKAVQLQITTALRTATGLTGDKFVIAALQKSTATSLDVLSTELSVAKGFQDYYATQLAVDGETARGHLKAMGITSLSLSSLVPDYTKLRVTLPTAPDPLPATATAAQKAAHAAATKTYNDEVNKRMTAAVEKQILFALKNAVVAGDATAVATLNGTDAVSVGELFAEMAVASTYNKMLYGYTANGGRQPGLLEVIGGTNTITTPTFKTILYSASDWSGAAYETKVLGTASTLAAAAVKAAIFTGLDAVTARALETSKATTFEALNGDIRIAKDFATYLANKPVIDAIISAAPDTAFAAGWVVTLLKAEELKLNQAAKSDFVNGFDGFLKNFGLDTGRASELSITLNGTSLEIRMAQPNGQPASLMTLANYRDLTGLGLVPASATAGATVTGTAGRDLWIASTNVASTFYDLATPTTASQDLLIGGLLNDIINGNAGDDVIFGRAGNDFLYGGSDNDILVGGIGNDVLTGQAGNDTYSFGRGDGKDTVRNADSAGTDRAVYASSIISSDLWFQWTGAEKDDLTISVLGTNDSVTYTDWLSDANARVDQVVAGDGRALAASSVNQLVSAMAAFSPAAIAQAADGTWTIPQSVKLAADSHWKVASSTT
jgi:RTX calcium-binding nonapeptide repeat (4 copies)/A nuclease family of the HNH/ENDO VII superfamily with conserved AHH